MCDIDKFKNCLEVGEFLISKQCEVKCLCIHSVYDIKNKKYMKLEGSEIYKILKNNNEYNEHFEIYEDE